MFDIDTVAAQAEVIIGGFAVVFLKDSIKVVNLNTCREAAVFTLDGMLVETNMDDIELTIARDVMAEAKTYAEI